MKRFWKQALVASTQDGAWYVTLDGRPMRLPGGVALHVHSLALAQALAQEWQQAGGDVGGEVSAGSLFLTQLASTAQERIAPDPLPTAREVARYGETDVLCYREASGHLAEHQARQWQPWLDWAARTYDATLTVTSGITHIAQPSQALTALRLAVQAYDANILAGMGVLVPALGSLVLGLAVVQGVLPAEQAHELALLDELWQERQWGEDTQAQARREQVRNDIVEAARFIRLCQKDQAA